jgi:hypothetical protein
MQANAWDQCYTDPCQPILFPKTSIQLKFCYFPSQVSLIVRYFKGDPLLQLWTCMRRRGISLLLWGSAMHGTCRRNNWRQTHRENNCRTESAIEETQKQICTDFLTAVMSAPAKSAAPAAASTSAPPAKKSQKAESESEEEEGEGDAVDAGAEGDDKKEDLTIADSGVLTKVRSTGKQMETPNPSKPRAVSAWGTVDVHSCGWMYVDL